MIQTVPYAAAAEIMSRYRPIAPKPGNDNSALPNGGPKSPYLRSIWAYLQARPTRTRKRGRPAALPLPYGKRTRACLQDPFPPFQVPSSSAAGNLACRGFDHVPTNPGLSATVTSLAANDQTRIGVTGFNRGIDLNTAADQMPEETAFPPELQEAVKPAVISPKPVLPVRSRIIVKSITASQIWQATAETLEEVEAVLEAEASPAIVSDSNNRVRLSNSSYKEMVGQPECGWLDCTGAVGGGRIGGEVVIQFGCPELRQAAGFHCRAKIEWESHGKKKSVDACGNGVKMECGVRDYVFLWRFCVTND